MPLPALLLRIARRSGEVSQGKTLLLRSGAAGFTCARVRMTFGHPRPLPGYPTTPALYPVSVRRLRAWPPASSPPRLTATQLPSARGSHHQGPQRTSTSSNNAMPGTIVAAGAVPAAFCCRNGEKQVCRRKPTCSAIGPVNNLAFIDKGMLRNPTLP